MGVNPLALLEGTMAVEGVGMPSLWGYNEYNETVEQLNQRLIDTTWAFQSFQMNAKDEMKKKEEHIQRLTHLLKITCQERDEAREQLQLLLKKVMPVSSVLLSPMASYFQPESPRLMHTKGNSSGTESDSVSDTHNRQSYVSSPVESFFDAETSPDFSNTNITDSCHIGAPLKPTYNNNSPTSVVCASVPLIAKYDEASAKLEQLASKRPLPEKGKLMDAVMKAGPLLQSLLVAGPLPRWKNPPPVQQLQIPPVSVEGRNSQTLNHTALNHTAALDLNPLVQSSLDALHKETSQGGSLMHGTMMKRSVALPYISNFACLTAKRQKTQ